MKFLWAGVAAFLVAGAVANGTPLDDKAKAFSDAVVTAAKATESPSGSRGAWIGSVPAMMATLQDENQTGQVEMTISGLMTQFSSTQAVQDAGQALLDQIRADRKAREEAIRQKLSAALQPLPDTLKKAEKPADLDATLKQLHEALGPYVNRGTGNPELQQLVSQVQAASRFVQGWQDYLSALQANDLGSAQGTLRNLSNNVGEGLDLVPRSELLAKINDLGARIKGIPAQPPAPAPVKPPAPDLFAKVKTLDDLAPVAAQARQQNNFDGYGAAVQALEGFAAVYGGVKAGLPVTLQVDVNQTLNSPDYFRVKALLYLYVMPRYLTGAPEPHADEAPRDYLHRVMTGAADKGDWRLLRKGLDMQRALRLDNLNGQFVSAATLTALQSSFNQEDAGQYALAVQSYQSALRVDDEAVPAKLIGQRLDAIKKDHPQEFEQGMQLVLNPPAPRYPAGYPYLPGMPQTMALQQMQAAASAPILIPGTNAAAAQPAPPAVPAK